MADAIETVVINGETHELGFFGPDLVAQFETWAKEMAWAEVEETRGSCTPDTYAARLDGVTRAIGARYYRMGNPGFEAAENAVEGKYYKVFLMLRSRNPKITLTMVQQWQRDDYTAGMLARIAAVKQAQKKQAADEIPDEAADSNPAS